MQRITLKRSLIVGVFIATFVIGTPIMISAVVSAEEPVQQTTRQDTRRVVRQELKQTVEKRESIKTRLTENKLKVCKLREKSISNIMIRASDRGNKQLETFTKIADRVKDFYIEKGLSLSNYNELVAEVDAKKLDSENAVAKSKEMAPTFKCDGTDPKGSAAIFKESIKAQNESLKAYRTAVKNLIVAVRSLNEKPTDNNGGQ